MKKKEKIGENTLLRSIIVPAEEVDVEILPRALGSKIES